MKILMSWLLLMIAISSFCQDADTIENFISKNGSVLWQKKFNTNLSFRDLINAVKRSTNLTNIDTFDNSIVGQSVEAFMDYKGAGYSLMNTAIYLSSSSYKSAVLIEYFDKSYIVTVSKIIFINQNDTKRSSPLLGSAQGETSQLEDYAIKKTGKFKSLFSKSSRDVIDHTFTKLYSF